MKVRFTNQQVLFDKSKGCVYFAIPTHQAFDTLDCDTLQYEVFASINTEIYTNIVSGLQKEADFNPECVYTCTWSDCDYDGFDEIKKQDINDVLKFFDYILQIENQPVSTYSVIEKLKQQIEDNYLNPEEKESMQVHAKKDSDKAIYNKRTWLNPQTCPYTGNIVCFDGQYQLEGQEYDETFVKVSDCYNSVKIHKGDNMKEFIAKVKLMRSDLDEFITYLENKYNK